jgi:pSer/pThr/pTyr-binding forkhead associated (FHA) protein
MRACLVVQEAGAQLRHPIEGKLVIGRDAQCDVRLTDLTISRRHARLEPCNGRFFLKDLESGNGTYVDGRRVQEEALTGGEILRFGDVPAFLDIEMPEELTTSQKFKQTLSVKPCKKTRPLAAVLVSCVGVLLLLSATAYEKGCLNAHSSDEPSASAGAR